MNQKTIYIGVLNQGNIRIELASMVNDYTHQNKYRLLITYPDEKPISNNRNKIVQDFLYNSDADYLLMIDADIIPPENLLNLADFQKDIISPICFIYQKNMVAPLVMRMNPEGTYGIMPFNGTEGLVEVDAVGTGCIILSRKVLEHPDLKAPFMNEYDQDGVKKYGLDFAFCRRAKKAGFKIYCHLDYACQHWVTSDLKKIYESLVMLNK